jgi:hypothetical protein
MTVTYRQRQFGIILNCRCRRSWFTKPVRATIFSRSVKVCVFVFVVKNFPSKAKTYCGYICKRKGWSEFLKSRNACSKTQSRLRRKQIADEGALAREMRSEGWEIFSPTVVCDRIGIKDGKVYFIEFKKDASQKLRPGQSAVQAASPDNYIIRFPKIARSSNG